MTADEMKAMYADFCQEPVKVGRLSGLGSSQIRTDYDTYGNARLYRSDEIVPGITQGDQRVIVLVDGLEDAGLTFPIKTSDTIVVSDKQRTVISFGERKALDGTLVAYEVQCRG